MDGTIDDTTRIYSMAGSKEENPVNDHRRDLSTDTVKPDLFRWREIHSITNLIPIQ